MADSPFYSELHSEFLSSTAARLQEVLQDYNHYLELVFIPTSKRDASDTKPYAIRDNTPGREGIIRHFSEYDIKDPGAILAWLFEGDIAKHGSTALLDKAMLRHAADELMKTKRDADAAEERQDLVAALATGGRDKKSTGFRHNGRIFTDRGSRATTSYN
jgi:hypothetical protein